jgi:hypothetical protein
MPIRRLRRSPASLLPVAQCRPDGPRSRCGGSWRLRGRASGLVGTIRGALSLLLSAPAFVHLARRWFRPPGPAVGSFYRPPPSRLPPSARAERLVPHEPYSADMGRGLVRQMPKRGRASERPRLGV